MMEIGKRFALVDEEVEVRVTGLQPGETYGLRAEMRDDFGRLWRAEAAFVADGEGCIDPARQAAVSGSYDGVEPMGLFWSMQLVEKGGQMPPFYLKTDSEPQEVALSLLHGEEVLAEEQVVRAFAAEEVTAEDAGDGLGFVGKYFAPQGGRGLQAFLVVGGSGGGFGWSEQAAAMLASRGFAAMAVAYFDYVGRHGLPTGLAEIPLEGFQAAMQWLRKRQGTDGGGVGVVGISKGAELALLLGSSFPQETGKIVAVAPTPYVMQGIRIGAPEACSSWTLDGKPLLFLPYPADYKPGMNFDKTTLRDLHERAVLHAEAAERSRIHVEKIETPVLLVSGDQDGLGPTTQWSEELLTRLRNGRHLRYPQAGHSFFLPSLPPALLEFPQVTPAGVYAAEREMWKELLGYLRIEKWEDSV